MGKEGEIILNIIRRKGFDFGFDPGACEKCPGYCCRGESGDVWVGQQDIRRICGFLHLHPVDFIQRYLNRIGNRMSMKERFTGQEYECVFFNGPEGKCSIYAVRPIQCRQFPFWNDFRRHKDRVFQECPGIIQVESEPHQVE
jgi:Fe-S-cluster containining protein